MAQKLDNEAFEFYVSLGKDRSYEAVGKQYGVTKKTVSRCATREDWAQRLRAIDVEAREKSDERLVETLSEMHTRHIKMLRAVQARSLKAIQEHPLTSGVHGMRMIDASIKLERLIRSEPNELDQNRKAEDLAVKIRAYVAAMDASVPSAPKSDADVSSETMGE